MTNLEEAAKLALEALLEVETVSDEDGENTPMPRCPWCYKHSWGNDKHEKDCLHERAVKALKEALK